MNLKTCVKIYDESGLCKQYCTSFHMHCELEHRDPFQDWDPCFGMMEVK
jgi:hypothetical protein